jgi:hypothetical protein
LIIILTNIIYLPLCVVQGSCCFKSWITYSTSHGFIHVCICFHHKYPSFIQQPKNIRRVVWITNHFLTLYPHSPFTLSPFCIIIVIIIIMVIFM